MVNCLKDYQCAITSIGMMFGIEPIWHSLHDCTNEIWTDYGDDHGEIAFTATHENEFGIEFDYAFEVYGTSRWESKCGGYTLFVGDDGCGERAMYIFDNTKKVKQ